MVNHQTRNFLLEIGTEELPPQELSSLIQALAQALTKELNCLNLSHGEVYQFATPRRLGIKIMAIPVKQPDRQLAIKGPSLERAFDQNQQPTLAAIKFAQAHQVEVAQLESVQTPKGGFLYYRGIQSGVATLKLLEQIIPEIILKLPCQRSMYWGDHLGPFARPVQWLTALWGDEVIPLKIFGIQSSRQTYGHRFHHPEPITLASSDHYPDQLQDAGCVIADWEQRKAEILRQIQALVGQNYLPILDEDLLQEVVNLGELPVAMLGSFDPAFLQIPREVLATTLKYHQRCFHLTDHHQQLVPKFIVIGNLRSRDPQRVIQGFEKVVRARLTDAQYFYQQDLQIGIAGYLPQLATLTFQAELGSMQAKAQRLGQLTTFLATKLGYDVNLACQAAQLAKADLLSAMVREFPELQGIMGYYYARDHYGEAVALALREQYLPRGVGDNIPTSPLGIGLALADRIDTLAGLFALGKAPTSNKDPLGLRRAATGVVRIILENRLTLNLPELFSEALAAYGDRFQANAIETIDQLLAFVQDRLQHIHHEQKREITIFRAVQATRPTDLNDFEQRCAALHRFAQQPDFGDLVAVYKRLHNILAQTDPVASHPGNLQPSPLQGENAVAEVPERQLAELIAQQREKLFELHAAGKYLPLLELLTSFKKPLQDFFAQVMVMAKDPQVRKNRLALLQTIHQYFLLVADLSFMISGNNLDN